ncbi:hypothetical protein [Streptomyces sp. NPDC002952]|uniref:hypothetical protein n=1 Tax=Streptomyces sp. NPDC002952 TaxID=3364673 RepID=UPI00369DE974
MGTRTRIAVRGAALLCAGLAAVAAASSSASADTRASIAAWKPPVGMEFSGSGTALSAAQTQAELQMHAWEDANHALCVKRSSTSGPAAGGWVYAIQAECFFS